MNPTLSDNDNSNNVRKGGVKNLSQGQKKIIYIALVVIAFSLLIWLLVYPQSRKLSGIKKEISSVEKEIDEITRTTEGKDLAEVTAKLNQRISASVGRFGSGEDEIIDYISGNARKFKIDETHKLFSEKIILENKVSGYEIRELPIAMDLTGDFKSLGEYFDTLSQNQDILFKIIELQVRGKGEGAGMLEASARLSAYLVK